MGRCLLEYARDAQAWVSPWFGQHGVIFNWELTSFEDLSTQDIVIIARRKEEPMDPNPIHVRRSFTHKTEFGDFLTGARSFIREVKRQERAIRVAQVLMEKDVNES